MRLALIVMGPVAIVGISTLIFTYAAQKGSILATGGKCIENLGAVKENQNSIRTTICANLARQQWSWNGDGTIRVQGLCLDSKPGATGGTDATVRTCSTATTQKWKISSAVVPAVTKAAWAHSVLPAAKPKTVVPTITVEQISPGTIKAIMVAGQASTYKESIFMTRTGKTHSSCGIAYQGSIKPVC